MRKILFSIVSLGALFGFAGTASAQTATTTFTVTAQVLENCSVTASNMAFGAYTPTGGDLASTSTIGVRCTNTTAYTVSLDDGSGTYAQRTMLSGANALEYNLYTTVAYATVWGDGTGGTGAPTGTGTGMANTINHTVYGRLLDSANNQNAPPANDYTDTITVTVTY